MFPYFNKVNCDNKTFSSNPVFRGPNYRDCPADHYSIAPSPEFGREKLIMQTI